MTARRLLVTGATGYIGRHVCRLLERERFDLRVLSRRAPSGLAPSTEIVEGDVLDPAAARKALDGVDAAYYLIHSMGRDGDFEARDRQAATVFAEAARDAGVRRIVYLGGLGSDADLSPHLRSRQEVGAILRSTGVPVAEFRASIVVGAGSLSFEMIRALVERLPVMIAPRWVETPCQPIAIGDVLLYLRAALDLPEGTDGIYEIGGADRATYGGLLREYARQRGLTRLIVPVPVLTPRLSSLWLGLVTPYFTRIGRILIESLRHPTVVAGPAASEAFPAIRPGGMADAVGRALREEDAEFAREGAAALAPLGGRSGNRVVDVREADVAEAPAPAWRSLVRSALGAAPQDGAPLWQLRRLLDHALGGVGFRRRELDPARLLPGTPTGFWRVESVEPGRRLRLVAELKLPGRAWLELEAEPGAHGTRLRQTAIFDPLGLPGLAYWALTRPLHDRLFQGVIGRVGSSRS